MKNKSYVFIVVNTLGFYFFLMFSSFNLRKITNKRTSHQCLITTILLISTSCWKWDSIKTISCLATIQRSIAFTLCIPDNQLYSFVQLVPIYILQWTWKFSQRVNFLTIYAKILVFSFHGLGELLSPYRFLQEIECCLLTCPVNPGTTCAVLNCSVVSDSVLLHEL